MLNSADSIGCANQQKDPYQHIAPIGDRMLNASSNTIRQDESSDQFYNELYSRNWPIIDKKIQTQVSQLTIAVAGCGSTGGAFIDGALRLGVSKFSLADNGSYELNNLNRQMVDLNALNINKAAGNQKKIMSVNYNSKIRLFDDGITKNNLNDFLRGADIVFDAVDVTTASGMKMKLELHERCAEQELPVASALDLGYTQWLQSYNYHRNTDALFGNLEQARKIKNPLKALIVGFCPIEDLPLEITIELIRLLKDPKESACQLGCACFLLSAMTTPYLLHFLQHKELPQLIKIDLLESFYDAKTKKERYVATQKAHKEIKDILDKIE